MSTLTDRRRRPPNGGLGVCIAAVCAAVLAANCASRSQPMAPGAARLGAARLGAARLGAAPAIRALAPVSDSGRDLTADQQVLQALNRLTFGPRPGDAARVRQMGVDRWIAQQLSPDRIPDHATDALVARIHDYAEPIETLEAQYPRGQRVLAARRGQTEGAQPTPGPLTREDTVTVRTAERAAARLVADVQMLKVARALTSERQLQEVMVDFWENHFTVYDRKGQQMRYYLSAYDRDAIRPHALGKFRDLLEAVAKSPAMLFYLDNWESVADSAQPTLAPRPIRRGDGGPRFTANGNPTLLPAPRRPARGLNENYGRELLELHTLGVDGGYTQQDVINVARALTGWSIERPRAMPRDGAVGSFVFRPAFHDAAPKLVLGHMLSADRGMEDGEEVLDIVARHPSTARFIARKLCQRFVSDFPPPALVDRVAATFARTDGDIRQVLWTIFTSPEFFSRAAYRTKVKSPFEVVVSALRVMGAEPDTTPRTAQLIARMGEPIFGHQAPNGYPETGESWMNTGAILNRINFGLAVAANRIPGASLDRWPEGPELMGAPRAAQVDTVVNDILGGAISPDTRAILMSGDHPLLSAAAPPSDDAPLTPSTPGGNGSLARRQPGGEERATDAAAMDGGEDMTRVAGEPRARGPLGRIPPLQGLAQVVGLALGAPEFQRR